MDSGFFIEKLNGFPRAYVNHALETIGVEGILKLMEGKENRNCKFKECLVYYDGDTMKFFEAETKGTLSSEIRGLYTNKNWSKLSYIFQVKEVGKTIAKLNDNESEKIGKSIYEVLDGVVEIIFGFNTLITNN